MADPVETDPVEPVTVHLSRPPAEVFPRLADLGRSLERDHDVDEVEHEGGPLVAGVPPEGTRYVATNRVDGRPERLVIELAEVEAPHRLVLQATSRGARVRETLELRPTDDDGCEVTVTTEHLPVPEGTEVDEAVDADPETGGPPPAGSADRPPFARIGELAARNALRDD